MSRTEGRTPDISALDRTAASSSSAGSRGSRRSRRAAWLVGALAAVSACYVGVYSNVPSTGGESVKTAARGSLTGEFDTGMVDYVGTTDATSNQVEQAPSPKSLGLASAFVTTELVKDGKKFEVRADTALVLPANERAARTALSAMGSRVLRTSPSGYWRIAVPEGMPLQSFLKRLEREGSLDKVQPEGIVRAASLADGTAAHRNLQWNLDQISWTNTLFGNQVNVSQLAAVNVAVIDSGVAYENLVQGNATYVASPDLAGSVVTAGPDFIDGDGHPNDVSGHGTHIANIIAANGGTFGVAPGVSLMPIRVLDGANSGCELDLVDAITYATEHGADVINLSLSFPPGYVPGEAMADAMQDATDSGSLVVASSGNNAYETVSYPASYANALAVGASRLTAGGMSWVADYTNTGSALDVVAPGGDINLDVNLDGVPDGIVAQTITAGEPGAMHYYLMTGTSQAAAHVSGAAALILSKGANANQARQALLNTSVGVWGLAQYWNRQGMGVIKVPNSINSYTTGTVNSLQKQYYVNVLPLSSYTNGEWSAVGMIQVLKSDGTPAPNVLVAGHWFGSSSSIFGVVTNSYGRASVATYPSDAPPSSGAVLFGLQVDRVVDGQSRISLPPIAFYFLDEGMNEALDQWYTNTAVSGSVPLFHAVQGTPNLPTWASTQYVLKHIGPISSYAPIAASFNQAYLDTLISSNTNGYAPVEATFSEPLPFGWGSASSVTMQLASSVTLINGQQIKLAVMPFDPALYFTNLTSVVPVINYSPSNWQSGNEAFWAGMSSSAIGAGVLGSIIGEGVLGSIIGEGVLGSIIGEGVLGSIIGEGVLGSIIGEGVLGSIIGENGELVLLGDGVLGSIIGESMSVQMLDSTITVPVVTNSGTTANAVGTFELGDTSFEALPDAITVAPSGL